MQSIKSDMSIDFLKQERQKVSRFGKVSYLGLPGGGLEGISGDLVFPFLTQHTIAPTTISNAGIPSPSERPRINPVLSSFSEQKDGDQIKVDRRAMA